MKKKLFSAVLSVMLVAFLSVGQASALTINLNVSDTDITVGEAFGVAVLVNGVFDDASVFGDEVVAFGFDIFNSDSSIVGFSLATVNNLLFDDDSAFVQDTDVAGSTLSGITDDSFLIATLDFTALSTGDVTLGIYSDTSDFNEGLVYWKAGNIDITSDIDLTISAAPIPEPATFLLVSCGLVGFAGLRKKLRKV